MLETLIEYFNLHSLYSPLSAASKELIRREFAQKLNRDWRNVEFSSTPEVEFGFISSEIMKEIRKLPPFPNILSDAQINKETIQETKKSLNLSDSYANFRTLSCNEHVQNWRDGCFILARKIFQKDLVHLEIALNHALLKLHKKITLSIDNANLWSLIHFKELNLQVQGSNQKILTLSYKNIKNYEYTLGYILIIPSTLYPNKSSMVFHNCCTSLSLKMLTLGYSTKRNDSQLAGYFGEGVKVEICKLLADNCAVSYYTNQSIWKFSFEPENGQEVLQVQVSRGSQRSTLQPFSNTMIIQQFPFSGFNQLNYLFLSNGYQSFSSHVIEVLLDEKYYKRVYFQGIYFESFQSDFPFGVNIIDKKDIFKLNIGRDRNSISKIIVGYYFITLFTESQIEKKNFNDFVIRFYESLLIVDKDSLFAFLKDTDRAPDISSQLIEIFLLKYGKNAIPVKLITPQHNNEATILGAKLVEVKEDLFNLLSLSPNFPKLENFWKNRIEDFVGLDEYLIDEREPRYDYLCKYFQFPNEEAINFAMMLKNQVDELLNPFVSAHQIRFKRFHDTNAAGNKRRAIPLDYNQNLIFIIDIRYFDPDLAHQSYAEIDPNFYCDSECSCMYSILIDDIKVALKQKNIPIESRINHNLRKRYYRDIAKSPRTPYFAKNNSSNNVIKTKENKTDNLNNNNINNNKNDNKNNNNNNNNNNKNNNNNNNQTDQTCKKRKFEEDEEQEEVSTSEKCASSITNSIKSTNNVSNVSTKRGRNYGNCKPDINELEKTSLILPFHLNSFWVDKSCKNLFSDTYPEYFFPFASTIYMLSIVFDYPTEKLFLFYQDKNLIAFNDNSSLYFNYRYFESIVQENSQQVNENDPFPENFENNVYSVLDFWFVIFCHECAHNSFSSHNKDHEYEEESILINYSSKFRNIYLSITSKFISHSLDNIYLFSVDIFTKQYPSNSAENKSKTAALSKSIKRSPIEWIFLAKSFQSLFDFDNAIICYLTGRLAHPTDRQLVTEHNKFINFTNNKL